MMKTASAKVTVAKKVDGPTLVAAPPLQSFADESPFEWNAS
jgi:hypothetical protein